MGERGVPVDFLPVTFVAALDVTVSAGETDWGRLCRAWLDAGSRLVVPDRREELAARPGSCAPPKSEYEVVGQPGTAWADLTASVAFHGGGWRHSQRRYSERALARLLREIDSWWEPPLNAQPTGVSLDLRRLGPEGYWMPGSVAALLDRAEFSVMSCGFLHRLKQVTGGPVGGGPARTPAWHQPRRDLFPFGVPARELEVAPPPAGAPTPAQAQERAEAWLAALRHLASQMVLVGGGIGMLAENCSLWEHVTLGDGWLRASDDDLAEDPQTRICGPHWVTVLPPAAVQRLGGPDGLSALDAFAEVEVFEPGSALCRATQDFADFDDDAQTRLAATLAGALDNPELRFA